MPILETRERKRLERERETIERLDRNHRETRERQRGDLELFRQLDNSKQTEETYRGIP